MALGIKRVINGELASEDFVIAQAEGTEAVRHPAQTLTGGVGVGGMRIGRANDLREEA